MDFSEYSNINERIKRFGGIKKTLLNKELLSNAEESWKQFTPEEISIIDKELPTALQVYSTIITSKAMCIYTMHTFTAIPLKNILWIYSKVITQRMNFIPYNKTHTLLMIARDGKSYDLGSVNTGGFSKKMPNDEKINQMQEFLNQYRKGIVYGYSDEIANLFAYDFGKAIEMVDSNSQEEN